MCHLGSILNDMEFDLILANPPYIPSTTLNNDGGENTLLKYGDGGHDGEEVMRVIFEQLRFASVIRSFKRFIVLLLIVCYINYALDDSLLVPRNGDPAVVGIVSNLMNVDDYPSKIEK